MERAGQVGKALVPGMSSGSFGRQRLKFWGPVVTLPWPPFLETYCQACRRMVEARPYGGGSQLIPVRHFRVSLGGQTDIVPCDGMLTPETGYGPGSEDPAAAFYSTLDDRTKAINKGRERQRSLIKIWST